MVLPSLAVVVRIGGKGVIITGLVHTPAAIAGVLILVQPVIAAAISWQLFDEPLAPIHAGGGFLILLGIFISQRGKLEAVPKLSQSPAKAAAK